MNFEESTIKCIEIINEALGRIGAEKIADNLSFSIKPELLFPDYVKYSVDSPDALHMELIITSDSLQVDLEDMSELYEWSLSQLSDNRAEVIQVLADLFSCTVEVERCGNNYRKLRFFDVNDECVRTTKYVSGLYLPFRCEKQKYAPHFGVDVGGADVEARRDAELPRTSK